jgi:hypothetical protein
MFLRFFGLGILAFEVSESHIERLVPEPDTDCGLPTRLPHAACRRKSCGSGEALHLRRQHSLQPL